MTLREEIMAAFLSDLQKMPHVVNQQDFDKYLLGFCRGIEHMTAKENKELSEIEKRLMKKVKKGYTPTDEDIENDAFNREVGYES